MSDPIAIGHAGHGEPHGPLVLSIEGARLLGVEFGPMTSGAILLRFPTGRLEVMAPARVFEGAVDANARSESGRLALKRAVSMAVTRVTLERGNRLEVAFEGGASLVVSLRGDQPKGAEAAAFFDENWVFEAY